MKATIFPFLLFIFLIFGFNANSQNWTNYTTSNSGLVNNTVNIIYIDTFGNKWFGTQGGISKFDGNSWTNFTTTNGLVNNDVREIIRDHQGNMWFGTMGGISRLNGSVWTNYTISNGLPSSNIQAIVEDKNGIIYCGGTNGNGIRKFNGTSWVNSTYQFCPEIHKLVLDKQKNIVCAALMDCTIYDYINWNYIGNNSGVNTVAVDKQNSKYFGYNSGVVKKLTGTTWSNIALPGSGNVNGICFDSLGNTWYATSNWLVKSSSIGFTVFNNIQGITNQNLKTVATETNGKIWAGGSGGVYENFCPTISVPVFSSGNANVCPTQPNVLYGVVKDSTVSNYAWTLPNNYIGQSDSSNISVSFLISALSDTIKVKAINVCGNTSFSSFPVQVTPLISTINPITSINGSQVLHGQTNVLYETIPVSGAVNYHWLYSGSGITINGNSNQISIDFSDSATSGTLLVYATDSCGNSSPVSNFNVLVSGFIGFENIATDENLRIFPNPAKNEINIKSSNYVNENAEIQIFDVVGRLLFTKKIYSSETIKLDISSLENGQYFIRIINSRRIINSKFIKGSM